MNASPVLVAWCEFGNLCKRSFANTLLLCKSHAPYGSGEGDGENQQKCPTRAPDRLHRVSTEDQGTDPQLDELRATGCESVLEEHASGADRSRPVLARLLR